MHRPGSRIAIVAMVYAALLAAGCAGVKPSAAPAPSAAPVTPSVAEPAKSGPPAAASAPAVTAPPTSPAAAPAPPAQTAARPPAPEAKAPAKTAAAPVAAATKAAPPAEAAKPKAPPLDLKALEANLKETKAIGVLTKLSLKNQVDDLLAQFRAFYQGKLKTTLAELRRPFDLLVLKLLALLQDSDPSLAAAIIASREAIWGILSDPVKFASLNGG
ncbi:MAG: hypothetical protein ABI900_10650 [Betaproteobacteria bacterium]